MDLKVSNLTKPWSSTIPASSCLTDSEDIPNTAPLTSARSLQSFWARDVLSSRAFAQHTQDTSTTKSPPSPPILSSSLPSPSTSSLSSSVKGHQSTAAQLSRRKSPPSLAQTPPRKEMRARSHRLRSHKMVAETYPPLVELAHPRTLQRSYGPWRPASLQTWSF